MSRFAGVSGRIRFGRAGLVVLGGGVAGLALVATLSPPRPTTPTAPPLVTAALGPVLLDPRPSISGSRVEPLPASLRRAAIPRTVTTVSASATVSTSPREPATTGSLPAAVALAPAPLALVPPASSATAAIPLPVPRPAEFRSVAQTQPAPAPRAPPRSRRVRQASAAAAPAPEPSFFERLFGLTPEPTYAALTTGSLPAEPLARPAQSMRAEGGVAIYDIAARTLTLPSGERLEAHSGLGDKMDDPRHVHVRMRGATPPGTYDLTEREALFHGVRAIRLNPVGGSGAVFGRSGLLAHTYMLGPNGDSNGCVSLRDYDRFLQAFVRGEVRRLVVVAGRGWDAAPGGPRMGRAGPADPSRG